MPREFAAREGDKAVFDALIEARDRFGDKEILEDQDTEQVAARIPFSGTIKNPKAGILETIVSVMRNAFVSAFARSLEGSVSLRDVKKDLKKIGDEAKPGGN